MACAGREVRAWQSSASSDSSDSRTDSSGRTRERFRDRAPLDLARGGARNRIHDVDLLRALEVRQPLPAVGQQRGLALRLAQDHRRRHLLTPRRMRYAERDRLRDRGMAEEHLVDLARAELLTAAVDQ